MTPRHHVRIGCIAAIACGSSAACSSNDSGNVDNAAIAKDGGAGGTSGGAGAPGGGAGGANGGSSSGGGIPVGGRAGTGGAPTGGAAGASSGGARSADAGSPCGRKRGLACGPGEFCRYGTQPSCGAADAGGICEDQPTVCPDVCSGVCGCDGKFYCNGCLANKAGTDVTTDTSCMPEDAGTTSACTLDTDCTVGLKCCYPCGIPGCQNSCIKPLTPGECPRYP